MPWIEAEDAEGFPARLFSFGKYNAYLVGEWRNGAVNWFGLLVHNVEAFSNPLVMEYHVESPLASYWFDTTNVVQKAQEQGLELVRTFVTDKLALLKAEIATLEAVL